MANDGTSVEIVGLLLRHMKQICIAMKHLVQNSFIHRDLAARNILLQDYKTVKLADFGLARDIYEDDMYLKMTPGKLPIRWMSPEAINDGIFSPASDV